MSKPRYITLMAIYPWAETQTPPVPVRLLASSPPLIVSRNAEMGYTRLAWTERLVEYVVETPEQVLSAYAAAQA